MQLFAEDSTLFSDRSVGVWRTIFLAETQPHQRTSRTAQSFDCQIDIGKR